MSRFYISLIGLVVLAAAIPVRAQRTWIVYPSSFNGSFQDHPTGEFNGGGQFGGGYRWGEGFDGVRRGFWELTSDKVIPFGTTTDPFPAKPATYFLEQWVPSDTPVGVTWDNTSWTELPIEVNYIAKDSSEEATKNLFIPWDGQFGTNHQWIKMELNQTPGTWRQAGPGPQCPESEACDAFGQAPTGNRVWLKRGSALYTKWNFSGGPPAHAITAIRITEAVPFTPTCDTATLGGPVDLRCVGNADPLYYQGEPFGGTTGFFAFAGADVMAIDGNNALAVDNFIVGTCITPTHPYNVPLTPGLPANGAYTAHLPAGDVAFQLHYDGYNTIKWKSGDFGGEYDRNRIFTLNGVAEQEFVSGEYGKLHFLSVMSGQNIGTLDVEAVYDDQTSGMHSVNLYEWFNQDGDATTIPVGSMGQPKSLGTSIGFARVNKEGVSLGSGGGDAGGAWLMAHTIEIDPCKTLTQVKLSISPDADGQIHVIAATFEADVCKDCATPIFDVAGGGVGRTEPDGSVDQYDFARFQLCLTGSTPPPGVFDPELCACMDVDNNEAVDGDDFQYFLACVTGPASGTPPPAGCDQP
jgi:hypothetical protein